MNTQPVTVEAHGRLNAREAAKILRAVGKILLPSHEAGDHFPYEIGSFFEEGEGCITYKPLLDGGMEMLFTPFNARDRILKLEERAARLESFCTLL